ncbi:MAG TPA: CUAEP/CCAEP-tail radical SAM protein [Terriglobales bacterium]|nr:CUAEP/CCAEP-tail radical SAM protein [Terriglobales bacterium]
MRVVLIATYEMGRQPFGLASPAAWLRRAGCRVTVCDTARQPLDMAALAAANRVGVYLPMHTATRLALKLLPKVREAASRARLCAFGLYAPLMEAPLRAAGVTTVLGGEFEADLVALATDQEAPGREQPLPRLDFQIPDRAGLPPLEQYAQLHLPDGSQRVVGYTEATRGCKHQCRHCPIVPIYGGQFRAVPLEVVLADIRQQVVAGARHITFGDPDFLNGPTHALRIVEALHREFPDVSFDATIKVEHLLRHAPLLPRLRESGCVLITSAVESFDDAELVRLDKGHTAADFARALALTRAAGLPLNPTFVSFTPWTTPASFAAMLAAIAANDLVEQVAPVQYGIRLLLPPGSRLLELPEIQPHLGPFDDDTLSYRWHGPADALCAAVQPLVAHATKQALPRSEIFTAVAGLVGGVRRPSPAPPRATIPYLDEPWFC